MREQLLRMVGALFAFALLLAAPALAEGRDFSDGLTGISAKAEVAGAGRNSDWQNQQDAAKAAAEQAMKSSAPMDPNAALGLLAAGDKLKLTVFGEEELSGEFEIDNTGSLALPLVGEVKAAGLSPRDLEKKLTKILEGGYLVNPRVNVESMNSRPFFILGEVNKPGGYPYVNDLTVINAVALGGGYTPRAKTGKVVLIRATDKERKEEWVTEDTKIYPGDIVRVDERFF